MPPYQLNMAGQVKPTRPHQHGEKGHEDEIYPVNRAHGRLTQNDFFRGCKHVKAHGDFIAIP